MARKLEDVLAEALVDADVAPGKADWIKSRVLVEMDRADTETEEGTR
jgi:hypothetical protein